MNSDHTNFGNVKEKKYKFWSIMRSWSKLEKWLQKMKCRDLGAFSCRKHRFSVMVSIWELQTIFQFSGHNVPKYRSDNFASSEWILALINTYDMSHHTCTCVKRFSRYELKSENLWRPLERGRPYMGVILKWRWNPLI